jgi:6-phosphogluconolactonase
MTLIEDACMNREIRIAKDADELAALAADLIQRAATTAVAQRGRFTLVLAGGHTPEKAYSLLVTAPASVQIPWSKTYFFFGDERFVPHDDSRSNFAMARRALLAQAPIAADHALSIPTNLATPADSAAAYANDLARFFGVPLSAAPPAFDLVLLGLGDDGHTASLFPRAAALAEQRAWVISSPPGVLPPPVDRVTLTFPVLNAARHVVFLVSGTNKAEPVRDVLGGQATIADRPAAGVQPQNGRVTWLLDEAAAELLPRP